MGWSPLDHPEVKTMAAAGTCGRHRNNVCRDLTLHFAADIAVPPLYEVKVPAVDSRDDDARAAIAPILLPHQLFAFMFESHRPVFDEWKKDLSEFWSAVDVVDDPHMYNHPVRVRAGYEDAAIPFALHGDGASFSRKDSLEVCSIGSLLYKAGTWRNKYVMGTWVSSAQVKGDNGTWDELWKVSCTKHTTYVLRHVRAYHNMYSYTF
jgi:hypothetical protein